MKAVQLGKSTVFLDWIMYEIVFFEIELKTIL